MANAASQASPPRAGPSSSSSSSPPPPAALPQELVEEILLRFPPDEPAGLLRAALVCKRWCRLVSGPSFRRRFREFHGTPPMLGTVLYDHFVPTTAFRPRYADRAHTRVVDARHGRVLLLVKGKFLLVWDPITDAERKVHFPRVPRQYKASFSWAAAVLCSADGCGHLDCHRGPFTLVFVRNAFGGPGVVVTVIWTYSSDDAAWSQPTCSPQPGYLFNPWSRSALVGNTLYFVTINLRTALKYNVQLRQTSSIQLPLSMPICLSTLLTATKDGGLLPATKHECKLYVWLMKDADDAEARWEQSRVVELKMLLPVDADFTSLDVIGSTDDLGIIFLRADDVVYAIDMKTYKRKKVYEGRVRSIVPFMSFYTPELEAAYAGERPSDGIDSSA